MTPEHLLSELTALGVRLWADGDALRFRAPAGALGAAHRAALRAHKPALLALLASADTPAATPDPAARHAPFPLTDVQTAYLLGRRDSFDLGGVACHGYLEVTFPALPPAAAEDAWNLLVARHDMLRATIHPDGHQQVLPEVPRYRIAAADLRGADPAALAAHLDRTRAELDHAVYDPATWPLFTLRITRTDAGDILHTSLDTLVADWASAGILFAELDAVLAGRADTLPPLALTFRDYLVAERRLRDTPRYARDRAYWLERAADLPPAPELPAAPAAGPPAGPPRFARHAYRLPADRWAALTAQAGAHDLTPATAVLAAYAAVLRRWSRHPRFALSVTLLNRLPLHPDVDRIVGDFTSVNVLDVADPAGRPFAAAAAALGTRLYTDLDHRLFSGVEVLREVTRRRGREAARLPVVFTSALGAAAGIDSRGAGRPGYGVTQTPQVVLDCQVGEDAGELVVHWDVRQGVLPDGVAADMFAAFTDLLAALAAGPDAWADPHPVPLPAWQAAERAAANDTAGPLPDRLLTDGFLARAAADPDRVAVLDAAGPTTYGALAGSAAAVAAALRARGVTAGQVVAVLAPKGVAQVAAVLGCGLAGAVYLPVDVHQPPLRRARLLADADARLVLTAAGTDTAGVGECPVVAVDTLAPADPPAPGGGDPDAPAYVIYTSGSTGAPKGVLVSHRAAANTIDDIDRRYGVGADDRVLGLAQLGFDLSVYDIFGPLTRGGTLVLPDPARPGDPSHWADLVRTHGVTVWNSVPAQLGMLLDYLGTAQLPSLRLALASGDWLPTTLPARCAAALPAARLVSLGGATEAAIWSIAHPVDAVDPAWPSIPYGRPLANQGWRVRAADGRDAPVWTAGELCITGAGLALGYLGDAALTAARFPTADGQRLYRTGDLGRYRPGGDIEFLGREDGQVKLRGHRIELGEVEAALAAHPDVADAAAVVAGTGADRALLGFVTPRRVPVAADPAADAARAAAARRYAAAQVTDEADAAALPDALRAAALTSLAAGLHGADPRGDAAGAAGAVDTGAPGGAGVLAVPRTADEVIAAHAVAERHHWLVRYWLRLLAAAGTLTADGDRYRLPAPPPAGAVAAAWDRVAALGAGADFVAYHREHVDRLPALLRGEQDPYALLFPDGAADRAAAIYRDDPASRYLNAAAAALAHRVAAAAPAGRPLRVVELGAGTGALTAAVLPLLAGFEVEYLFTDVNPSFLPEARDRFGGTPGVGFGVVDLDRDTGPQGLAPHAADLVLCAGMLNSVADPAAALHRVAGLLAAGGWLIATEPTEALPHILLTQGFLMRPGPDGGPPLYAADRWARWIAEAGGTLVHALPGPDDPQAARGMHALAARFRTDRADIREGDVRATLADRLPPAMRPGRVQVLDALPLTANGKVDRRALAERRLGVLGGSVVAEPEAGDDLERRLCRLWAGALGVPRVAPGDNVYDHGAESLILARVAGRLREEVPEAAPHAYDTLLRQLLNEPTVAALAAMLRGGPPAEAPAEPAGGDTPATVRAGRHALLVPFGGGADGPARVLFHAALGTLDYFQGIGRALADQRQGPVLGLAVADPEAYLAVDHRDLVAALADDYAAALAGQGHRRFQLIGYCLGGLLAIEVARRLQAAGHEVVDLSLVDSLPMLVDTDEELVFESIFVPNLDLDPVATVLGPDLDPADLARAVDELMLRHDGRVPAGALAALDGDGGLRAVAAAARRAAAVPQAERLARYAAASADRAGVPVGPELVPALFRMCRHSMRAARFDPEPYVGDMRFLRAAQARSFGVTAGVGHLAAPYWEKVCLGTFEILDVPGDHFSVIEPPALAEVVAALSLTAGGPA